MDAAKAAIAHHQHMVARSCRLRNRLDEFAEVLCGDRARAERLFDAQHVCSNSAVTESVAPEWKVYPNPAGDRLTIAAYDPGMQRDNIHYRLTDSRGRVVRKGRISGNSTTIDLSEMTSGVYMVEVYGDDVQFRRRIVRR